MTQRICNKFLHFLCIPAGACGLAAAVRLFIELRLTDVIHYNLYFAQNDSRFLLICAAITGAVLDGLLAKKHKALLLPLLLLLPGLLFFSNSFSFLLLAILTIALLGFQIGRTYPLLFSYPRKKWCILFIFFLFIFSASTGYFYQLKAFKTLHFQYHDWAEYAEYYLRAPLTLTACGHWNPLPTSVGHLLLTIIPAPETLFALNALLIASAVPFAACLAIACKLPLQAAAVFASITAFSPIFTHQHLCSFYGYHPVVYLIPLILLFFIFEARKNLIGMLICALFMLLIQETSAILWFSWGLYKMTERKKFLPGLMICLTGGLLFLLLCKVVSGTETYVQAGRYQQLGNSIPEILLSPILRPAAFFNILLERHSLYFAAVLFLPTVLAILPRLRSVLMLLPLTAGVLLQNYPSNKTAASQYGLEITACLLALAISSTGMVKRQEYIPPAFLKISCRRYVPAILSALLFSTFSAYIFWGHSFILGKWSFAGNDVPVGDRIIRRPGNQPDMQNVYTRLCRYIQPDSRLLASDRIRSRFVFRNRTFPIYAQRIPGDVIVLDTDSIMPHTELRKSLYFSSNVHLTDMINYRGTRLLIYRVSPPGVKKHPLPFLRTADRIIGNSGTKIVEDNHFDLRILQLGQNAILTARVKKTPSKDADFTINIQDQKTTALKVRFANGALPASAAVPGQVFLFSLPISSFKSISVRIDYSL